MENSISNLLNIYQFKSNMILSFSFSINSYNIAKYIKIN